jgi:bacteriocin biosynthesis cyclodehydratase domain-containing protein
MQVQLKPALRRVWRDSSTIQIGLSERRGTVIAGLTGVDVRLLDTLRTGINAATLPRSTPAWQRARELIRLLSDAGVLAPRRSGRDVPLRLGDAIGRLAPDAAVWSVVYPEAGDGWDLVETRRGRHVVVAGAGRLGTTLAAVLAAAGIGRVTVEDDRRVGLGDVAPAGAQTRDLGRSRADAAVDAVGRAGAAPAPPPQAGETGDADPSRAGPDAVVLVDHAVADTVRANELVRADVPHLSVVVRDDDVVVGPLVRPGHGPCLRCLDLHRGDRDPAWPSLLAQLRRPPPGTPEPEESAVTTLAAGLAALQVLALLDGLTTPAADGATLEIELPDGLVGRREWPAHPRCGCNWPPS